MVCSICEEFKIVQECALKDPETSEELMDMISFVEKARTAGMIKLNERIKVRQFPCVFYFQGLDVWGEKSIHLFCGKAGLI